MESKDLKQVLLVGCLSAAMIISSHIIGNSFKDGLLYFSSSLDNSGFKITNSVADMIRGLETPNIDSDVLNESEAADFLKISPDKITYLLINSKAVDGKGIPHFNVGNNIYFSKTALTKWVAASAENCYEY